MKIQVSDGDLFIRWQYKSVPVLRQGVEIGTTKQTTCIASRNGETVAEASVKKFHLDTDDKDEARKQSMIKLLDTLAPIKKLKYHGSPDVQEIARLRAELKKENASNKEFWHAYMTRKTPDLVL
jgi:hypothetical protein